MKISKRNLSQIIKKSLLQEIGILPFVWTYLTGCSGSDCSLTSIMPEAEGVPDPPDCVVVNGIDNLNIFEIFEPYKNEDEYSDIKSITLNEFKSLIDAESDLHFKRAPLENNITNANLRNAIRELGYQEKRYDNAIILVKNIPKGLISSFLTTIGATDDANLDRFDNLTEAELIQLSGFHISFPIIVIDDIEYVCASGEHLESLYLRFDNEIKDVLSHPDYEEIFQVYNSMLDRITTNWWSDDRNFRGDVYFPSGGVVDSDCNAKWKKWLEEYIPEGGNMEQIQKYSSF